MRRVSIVLVGFAVVWIAAENRLNGQQQSSSLTVTASVSKNCTITTVQVSFGPYDPVAANASAPLDGLGSVTVTCTKGAEAKVDLDNGLHDSGGRQMSQGSAFLKYELYQDSAHSIVWGQATNGKVLPPAPDKNPRTFNVYGRVAQAQDATVGSYTDTVMALVNF